MAVKKTTSSSGGKQRSGSQGKTDSSSRRSRQTGAKQAQSSRSSPSQTAPRKSTGRQATAKRKRSARRRNKSSLLTPVTTFLSGLFTSSKRRKSKTSRNTTSYAVIFAFIAGLAMAGVCYMGIQALRSSDPAPRLQISQHGTASLPVKRATPLVLPPVGQQGHDAVPSESGIQAAMAIQQALVELQQAASTDQITPFTELARQTNFAILQAAFDAKIPSRHIRITGQKEKKHSLGQYTYQSIAILGPPNFPRTLETTLQTWKTEAKLTQAKDGGFTISIHGVPTHHIMLYTDTKLFNGDFPESGRETSGVPYPPQRSAGTPAQLVIVIDDLGASNKSLDRLINLNFPVTCAFWPDAAHSVTGARRAHAAGLEILVHMPMEPVGYPRVNPGKDALLHTMSKEKITALVQNAIHKIPYATGLNNHMGSKFTQDRQRTAHVLNVLYHNGMFMLDSVTHGRTVFYDVAQQFHMPRFRRNVFLDADESPAAIMASLSKSERIALLTGQAIAIGHPLPNTLAALEKWQHERNTSIQIVRLADLRDQGLSR